MIINILQLASFLYIQIALSVYLTKKVYQLKSHTPSNISILDLKNILIITAVNVIFLNMGLNYLCLLLTLPLVLILWSDSILIHCYGLKISLKNIKVFISGIGTFSGEAAVILNFIARFQWITASVIFSISCLFAIITNNSTLIALAICSLLFSLSKSRLKPLFGLPWLILTVLLSLGLPYISDIAAFHHFIIMAVVAHISYTLINALFIVKNTKVKSIFSGLLVGNDIKKHAIDENIAQIQAINSSVSLLTDTSAPQKQNLNILLFTVESLSEEAYSNSPYSKMLDEHFPDNLLVDKAYSVSPNTNQSIYQLYTSCYGNNSSFINLQSLTQQGYSTTYITTQETQHFGMNELLKSAGFNTIYDRFSFPTFTNDYDLLNLEDEIAKKLQSNKAFIHISNDQTHSNYKVIDKQKFNRCNNKETKGRYFNAVDESLYIINKLLLSLKDKGGLENTLLVITGDHGQSFGELGYYAHSSATINPQVRVPFKLHCSKLAKHHVEQITLLDIMPTITYLLGQEYPQINVDGINVINNKTNYTLLYSDTRAANAPSNASVIIDDIKYYVDTIYNQRLLLDSEDNIITDSALTENDIESIVYHALDKHGLIY